MPASDGDDGTPPRKPRAKGGRAKVEAAMEDHRAQPTPAPTTTPVQSLTSFDVELRNIDAAVSILRPNVLVFVRSSEGDVLDPDKPSNEVFVAHETAVEYLCEVVPVLEANTADERQRLHELVQRARRLRQRLREIKELGRQLYQDRAQRAELHQDHAYDNTPAFSDVPVAGHGPNVAFALVIVCAHLLLHTTVEVSQALLTGLNICLAVFAFAGFSRPKRLPHQLRTVLSMFPLDANVEAIACCPNPECCKLHLPDGNNRLLERCDAAFDTWKCNWIISKTFTTRDGNKHIRPIRAFHFQSVTSWIGQLLARPNIEATMENYVESASNSRSVLEDIWHSGFFRRFQWAQGGNSDLSRGFVCQDGELRLLFSLAIDWFTAHGGKQAGKKWSIGAIYLVCQNLPLEIRFKPENVCLVGVIPGRTKPLGSAVNWFLRRLVDEFVLFYERGIWYTQTFRFPSGRLVRAAIGPVVCDLDAARGIAGFGSISHTLFCSLCSATKHEMADFDTEFEPRCGSVREGFPLWTFIMNLWNSSTSVDEQAGLWKEYGIRWTELARLRYWNPFQFLVIDVMHCLFLGLFRRHFRFIWRMDVDACGWGDEVQVDPGQLADAKLAFADPDCTEADLRALSYRALQGLARNCDGIVEELVWEKKALLINTLISWKRQAILAAGPGGPLPSILVIQRDDGHLSKEWLLTQPRRWRRMTKVEVVELCELGGIIDIEGKTKKALESALQDRLDDLEKMRSAAAAEDELDLEPSVKPATGKRRPVVALGRGVLSAVSKDIQRTTLPDWIDPAPKHVGNTKHGKLSANHWRSLCTIHCVITLIRLWGILSLDNARYQALENFIFLVKAVQLATLRSTTESRQHAYSTLMKRYLKGLKVLYPAASITPNHHLATHIPQFLRRFGPPHSWWAFPFERYNGMLQKIKTNDIIGSMEKTIFTKFAQAARLRVMIIDAAVPDVAKPLLGWAMKLMRNEYSGTLMTDNDAAPIMDHWTVESADAGLSSKMNTSLRGGGLDPASYRSAKSIQQRGMTFSAFRHLPSGQSVGNCVVHIELDGQTSPARIREIAYRPQGTDAVTMQDVHLLVDCYEQLSESDVAKDPYRRWRKIEGLPGLDCHLRYANFDGQRTVALSSLVCHAAMCEYEDVGNQLEQRAMVFLGLNRNDERGL